MKYLKLFESQQSEKEIRRLCNEYYIYDYTINSDVSIDVNGDVYLNYKNLTKLPVKFNRVTGYFICNDNRLTSFENFPKYISNILDCKNNNIRTFEGFPEHVSGNLYCFGNPIWELWRLFLDTKLIELFNDYDIIRENGQVIILDRLNEFLREIGKKQINYVEHYKCL